VFATERHRAEVRTRTVPGQLAVAEATSPERVPSPRPERPAYRRKRLSGGPRRARGTHPSGRVWHPRSSSFRCSRTATTPSRIHGTWLSPFLRTDDNRRQGRHFDQQTT